MSTIGSQIDKLFENREERRRLEKEIERLSKEAGFLEAALMEQMDKEGVDKSSGRKASVSIGESVKPNVEDWDAFWKYIFRHKASWLVERRPSVTACRELFETKGKIPGVVPFTKRSLSIRTRD